jgi:RNA polymerase sigma factor (TIGR02999 family)
MQSSREQNGAEEQLRDVTELLLAWTNGDPVALDQLVPLVYDELRRVARNYLRRERKEHTLQPTALVHESFLRLLDQRRIRYENRTQFFAVAALLMRRILVNHAVRRQTARRGGGERMLTLQDADGVCREREVNLLALDSALSRLVDVDPRQNRIVELHFFAGFTMEEIAEALDLSVITVKREWRIAKAWLRDAIEE